MLKLFEEHPEFDQFTRFDTTTGRLETIAKDDFERHLPPEARRGEAYITRIVNAGVMLFSGATPATHVRFPRRVYFQITRNCNLQCDYCFIKAGPSQAHVPTGAIYDMAEYLGAHGLMEVRLTGGEPTSHPEFLEVMHKFKAERVYVSVATNGVWSSRLLAAFCEEPYLWIICSVDGPRAVHERYRPGTFDHIVTNLTTLKQKNPSARIRLTTVLTSHNKGQIMDLGKLCSDIGVESITVIPLRPQVRQAGIRGDMVTASEFREVIEDLIRAQEMYGVPFTTTMETDYKDKIYRDPIVRKRSSCAAGREATNLDYDSTKKEFLVYGCSYSPACDFAATENERRPFLAGTFSAAAVDHFLDIWRNEEAWRIYRDLSIRSQSCLGCPHLASHQCTGSCPIQNIDYTALSLSEDMLTQLTEQIRRTAEWYCYKWIKPPL